MNKLKLAIIAIAFFTCAPQSRAVIVELPIDAAGEYTFNEPYSTFNFDFGLTFSEISSVSVKWSGQLNGGLAQLYSGGDPYPEEVGIYAYFPTKSTRSVHIWGGVSTHPAPESFDLISEVGGSWNDLLDGKGSVIFGYSEVIMTSARYVAHGSVVLDSAVLMIEGTVVPEPMTLLLMASGAILIHRKKRWF